MKIHDLEYGYPIVKHAIDRLKVILHDAKKNKEKVIAIIHGYGSSGVGGKIKRNVHEFLEEEIKLHHIEKYIKGENFNMYNDESRNLHLKYPETSEFYNKDNKGITIIKI